MSHVAPRAVPQGKQAAVTPLKNLVPRTPLGPSETRIEGTPCLGRGTVCHQSCPVCCQYETKREERFLL